MRKQKVSKFNKLISKYSFTLLIIGIIILGGSIGSYIGKNLHNDDVMFTRNGYTCTWGEFKEISAAGYRELKSRATKECSKKKSVKLTPVSLLRPYALINVNPDMVNCITDEAWMVLEKKEDGWKFVLIGTDPRITTPFFQSEKQKDPI